MNLATVAEFLQYTEMHSIRVTVEGDKLVLEADLPSIPGNVLDAARRIKPQLLVTLSAAPAHDKTLGTHVFRMRVDGCIVTTHADHGDPDQFLQSMVERFGNDRRISVLGFWPIKN